ncbi:aspartic proteinase CDR1-like [Nymphaea colorata]|nr:aspartic proteinase CDR1-like [Nymphaea colorata]
MAPLFSSLAFRLLIQLLLLAVLPKPTSIFASKPLGFSIDLIHRDSSLSPLFDPSFTLAQRAEQAALRSMLHSSRIASRFANTTSMISSPVMPGSGILATETLLFDNGASTTELPGIVFGCVHNEGALNPALLDVPFHVGLSGGPLPLVPHPACTGPWAIINTGSNLIWTTCCLCDSCPIQTPIFDPFQSSTYKNWRCSTRFCTELHDYHCISDQLCLFRYSYGDNSTVEGLLASETLLFDNGADTIKREGIVFGCVHSEENPDSALCKVSGLVGLGRGPLSLVKQIGSSIDDKFAYYLPPYRNENNSMGQVKFGEDAEFSGTEKFLETPMASDGGQDNNGDPYEGLLEMTFCFVNADWKLPPSNIFMMFESGITCLAIKDGQMPIFGNIAHQNMHVKFKDYSRELLNKASFVSLS